MQLLNAVNLITLDERAKLMVNIVSNLMFIKFHGPPLRKGKPQKSVICRFRRHRFATDTRTRTAKPYNPTVDDPLWKYLHNFTCRKTNSFRNYFERRSAIYNSKINLSFSFIGFQNVEPIYLFLTIYLMNI